MADGSLIQGRAASVHQDYFAEATVFVDEKFAIDFGVPAEMCDSESMKGLSTRLVDIACSTLRVALVRGENDADFPNTFSSAVSGAHVLLQLSMGLDQAARRLAEVEKL